MEAEDIRKKALRTQRVKPAALKPDEFTSGVITASTTDNSIGGLMLPVTYSSSALLDSQPLINAPIQPKVPFDLDMYIIICMGNVYQSSGDDEQALKQYISGWSKSKANSEIDWAAVFLSSIGIVSYYNLRYELGYQCFASVADYRMKVIS